MTGEVSRPVRGGSGQERSRNRSRRRGEWPGADPWVAETRGRAGREPVTDGAPRLESGMCPRTQSAHTSKTRITSTFLYKDTRTRPCAAECTASSMYSFAHACTRKRARPFLVPAPYPSRTIQRHVHLCPYGSTQTRTCVHTENFKDAHLLHTRQHMGRNTLLYL